MSYGPDIFEHLRQAVIYIDRLLKGAKLADLPMQQPTKMIFAVNLKTAKALGLTIPPRHVSYFSEGDVLDLSATSLRFL